MNESTVSKTSEYFKKKGIILPKISELCNPHLINESIKNKLKGQLPIGLLTLKAGVTKKHEDISKECVQMIRKKIGPVAAFKTAIVIKRLPKTRSGKILRGTVRKIADNEPYKMPATIDDPAILDEIKGDLKKHNILK